MPSVCRHASHSVIASRQQDHLHVRTEALLITVRVTDPQSHPFVQIQHERRHRVSSMKLDIQVRYAVTPHSVGSEDEIGNVEPPQWRVGRSLMIHLFDGLEVRTTIG